MPALVYSSRRCFFQYDNWQPISTPHSQHGISQKARKVVFILTASSNSLFDNSWAMPHTTSDVQSTPIYDQLQSAIIRNDQHDQHLPFTLREAMISLTVHLCRHPDQGHLLTTELSSATHRSFISSNNHPVCLLGAAPLVNYQYIQQPNCLTIHDSNGVSTTSCAYSASLYYQW